MYSSNKKRNKWYYSARMLGVDLSGFGTLDHNLHCIRRAAANPYFSAASVRRLQPVIKEKVKECLGRLRVLKDAEVVSAAVVTSAFGTGKASLPISCICLH
jgi:cytochrome P450